MGQTAESRPPARDPKAPTISHHSTAQDILLTVLCVFSILLGFALRGGERAGVVGRALRHLTKGLLGPVAYSLPLLIFIFSIYFLVRRRPLPRQDISFHTALLLIAVAALLHTITVPVSELTERTLALSAETRAPSEAPHVADSLRVLWEGGIDAAAAGFVSGRVPGGVLGGLMSAGFVALFGKVGATLVLIAALMVEAALLFNFSLTRCFDRTGTALRDARRQAMAHRAAREAHREAMSAPSPDGAGAGAGVGADAGLSPDAGSGSRDVPRHAGEGDSSWAGRTPSGAARTGRGMTFYEVGQRGGAPRPKARDGFDHDLTDARHVAIGRGDRRRTLVYGDDDEAAMAAPGGDAEAQNDETRREDAHGAPAIVTPDFVGRFVDEDEAEVPGHRTPLRAPQSEVPYREREQGADAASASQFELDLASSARDEAPAKDANVSAIKVETTRRDKGADDGAAATTDEGAARGAKGSRDATGKDAPHTHHGQAGAGQADTDREDRGDKAGPGTEAASKAKAGSADERDREETRDTHARRPYKLPPLNLLQPRGAGQGMTERDALRLGRKLEDTLESFGVEAEVVHITSGPTITRFELKPGPGVKVSRIVNLSDDIALSLAALGVRIEAPIPGKSAIGIEIPNRETAMVGLRALLEEERSNPHKQRLMVALGRDIPGRPIYSDLARMPHLLIAGATGSGKSICINVILMNILYRAKPDEVKLLLIDPKIVELSTYNGIPHLLAPVVTDPKEAANTLNWAVAEMTRRYGLFAKMKVRDLPTYNRRAEETGEEFLPLIVLVIDELSDLMVTAAREVEDAIARLTAMARAAGIHLVIATQRPSVDVITGVIKANMPSRIAFAVTSQVDSRTILDQAGAEKLLGKGDMLYYPQSSSKPIRGQGAYVSEAEVEQVVSFIRAQEIQGYDADVAKQIISMTPSGKTEEEEAKEADDEEDELLTDAVEIVLDAGYASVSILQRRLQVGYPRAARLVDRMEQLGYIGPFEGSKPRKVIITHVEWETKKRQARQAEGDDPEPILSDDASPEEIEALFGFGDDEAKEAPDDAGEDTDEDLSPPFDL